MGRAGRPSGPGTRGRAARAALALLLPLLALAGCATAPTGGAGGRGALAAAEAADQKGVPYRYGGADPSGFDCSGLARWCWSKAGVVLPRRARDQFAKGRKVGKKELRPGDLVFFSMSGGRAPDHVGVYQGGGLFIHAPSSGGKVRSDRLDDPYWSRRAMGARRPGPS